MRILAIVAALLGSAAAAPKPVEVAAGVPLPAAAGDTNMSCDECADKFRYCMNTSISWILNDDKSQITWQNDHESWICAKRTCVQYQGCKDCGWKCDYSEFQNERPATPAGFKPPSPYEDKRNT